MKSLVTIRCIFYDHFGSIDVETISSRIRYMVKALGVRWIFLDHLSIMVSGIQAGHGDGEKTC